MARVQLLLCFTFLIASVTLMEVVSAHLNIKPTLPQIEDPKTVNDVEAYTVKVVTVFVSDLEKECPKTSKFKAFFEKLRAYAKFVCPIPKRGEKDYDRDMKAKAGSLFQSIASFAVGKIKEEIREEKEEAIATFKWMKSLAGRILGGRKKEESEENMKLTAEQCKEIKEGILKWETVIAKIANTMVQTTTTTTTTNSSSSSSSSSDEGSTSGKTSPTGSKSSGSGGAASFKDTTGSGSNSGASPSGSPTGSPSGSTYTTASAGGSGSSNKDTSGGGSTGSGASGSSNKDTTGKGSTGSGSSESASSSSSQSSSTTVAEVEAETSKEVMEFIMNLEKKCPPKEEYKSFLEKIKSTMAAGVKVTAEKKKGFFAGLKSATGKISDAMSFIGSRITGRTAEVKKSMEDYQAEVMKALQELETIHSKIISQSQGKKDGSVTVTAEQRTEIKQTITKWEQVTTQFVETAIKSESSSNTTAGIDKVKLPEIKA